MKLTKLILLVIITLSGTVPSLAQQLPKPQTTGGAPLMQVMSERRSSRDMTENAVVTRQELSNMLWAAWGVTHDGKHTIATAMNRQELSLYVITATEVSLYDPEANTLTVVSTGDFRPLAAKQGFAAVAPVNIALVVDTEKQSHLEFQAYTAGAASQNIYLYCAQAGLKTVVRAAGFDRDELPKALKLKDNEKIIFIQTVGR